MNDQHPSLDALADLLAGEGDDPALDHLASCDRCSGQLADLEAALVPVAAELAALAASPLPAPPDLEQVLVARLRAEEQAATTGLAAAADVVPAPVVPLRPRATAGRPRAAGLLGAAAGAVGLLALVGLGLGLSGGSGSGDSATGAGGGLAETSEAADVPTLATGNDYRPESASFARALPALLAPGTLDRGTAALDSAVPEAAGGGTAGQADGQAAGQADGQADGQAAGQTSAGDESRTVAGAPAVDSLARLRDPAELAGCLSALTGPDTEGVPLALDYAAFQGQPALVVVLPAAREGSVDVFTVGAGCRAGDDQTLFFTRLPRP